MVQQASNGIIKAVQQGSVAHAEMGGWGEMGGTRERERSEVSVGCAGFKWKVWGLAQGCRQIHEWDLGGVCFAFFGKGGFARQGGSVLTL